MKKIKLSLIIFSFSFFIYFFININNVHAANFLINGDSRSVRVGSILKIQINVDTQNENLNTFSGTIKFPNNLLALQEIKTGSSIINLFIEEPKEVQPGQVNFSGITPGGYTGQGFLMETIFKAKADGNGTISLQNALAFHNDGSGSAATTTSRNFDFAINSTAPAGATSSFEISADKEAPEAFTPTITKIPDIGGNNYLLLFATEDKISGIDHYEVKEGDQNFKIAVSPYLLADQGLKNDIIVKAVDKNNNERLAIVKLRPENTNLKNKTNNLLLKTLIILLIAVFIILSIFWFRFKKDKPNKK